MTENINTENQQTSPSTESRNAPGDAIQMMSHDVIGSGPPLVMLGGGATGIRGLQMHAERLSGHRTAVRLQSLNVDWGTRDFPLAPDYSVKSESRAMRATIEALGLSYPIDIMGWCLGGIVALDFALDSIEMVRSLVLVEPAAYWALEQALNTDAEYKELMSFFRGFVGDITREQIERLRISLGDQPGRFENEEQIMQIWMQYRGSLRCMPAVASYADTLERVRGLEKPVLLIEGKDSMRIYRSINDVLERSLPNVRRVKLPGGHASSTESIDLFMDVLTRFHAAVEG